MTLEKKTNAFIFFSKKNNKERIRKMSKFFHYLLDENTLEYTLQDQLGSLCLAKACVNENIERLKSEYTVRRASIVHPPCLLAKKGNLEMLKFYHDELLDKDEKHNIQEKGMTLHTAAKYKQWHIIHWLTSLPSLGGRYKSSSMAKEIVNVLSYFMTLFYANLPGDIRFSAEADESGTKFDRLDLVEQVVDWVSRCSNRKRKVYTICRECGVDFPESSNMIDTQCERCGINIWKMKDNLYTMCEECGASFFKKRK